MPANAAPTRRRLTREQRARQLLDVAWALVGDEGTDALTLGRLAEAAGVTKPVAYDHFVTRNGLLAALDSLEKALAGTTVDAKAHQQIEGRLEVLRARWAGVRGDQQPRAEVNLDDVSDEEMFALLDEELS